MCTPMSIADSCSHLDPSEAQRPYICSQLENPCRDDLLEDLRRTSQGPPRSSGDVSSQMGSMHLGSTTPGPPKGPPGAPPGAPPGPPGGQQQWPASPQYYDRPPQPYGQVCCPSWHGQWPACCVRLVGCLAVTPALGTTTRPTRRLSMQAGCRLRCCEEQATFCCRSTHCQQAAALALELHV